MVQIGPKEVTGEMTGYQKLFGAGPRGGLLSVALFLLLLWKEKAIGLPAITDNSNARLIVFSGSVIATIGIVVWSLRSLPPSSRGESVVQEGAFALFRHPLYAAFLSFFNFGLAIYVNNWVFILWALALHPLWHWNIRHEERLMISEFGDEYVQYARKVSRFFPAKFFLNKLSAR